MKNRDGRSLDHKALEDIRIQAVKRVEAGEAPSAVIISMLFFCCGGIELAPPLPTSI